MLDPLYFEHLTSNTNLQNLYIVIGMCNLRHTECNLHHLEVWSVFGRRSKFLKLSTKDDTNVIPNQIKNI